MKHLLFGIVICLFFGCDEEESISKSDESVFDNIFEITNPLCQINTRKTIYQDSSLYFRKYSYDNQKRLVERFDSSNSHRSSRMYEYLSKNRIYEIRSDNISWIIKNNNNLVTLDSGFGGHGEYLQELFYYDGSFIIKHERFIDSVLTETTDYRRTGDSMIVSKFNANGSLVEVTYFYEGDSMNANLDLPFLVYYDQNYQKTHFLKYGLNNEIKSEIYYENDYEYNENNYPVKVITDRISTSGEMYSSTTTYKYLCDN